jgi:endonuclease-3
VDKKEKVKEILKELKRLFPNPTIALKYNSDFNLLVAVILSAQTIDKKVNEITPALFSKFQTAKDYSKLNQSELEAYIRSIGLYRGKAKNILSTAKIIDEKYKGEIPHFINEMVELPGVGRKTANVVLGIIYKTYEGIAVDTHVRRLTKLWGLTKNINPDKIEKDLMEVVPYEDWPDFTYLVIDYGRAYCPAHCKHTTCPLRKYIVK